MLLFSHFLFNAGYISQSTNSDKHHCIASSTHTAPGFKLPVTATGEGSSEWTATELKVNSGN